MYWYTQIVGAVPENPFFLQMVLVYMQKTLLMPAFSFWAFMVGGVAVATIAALGTYIFFIGYYFFKICINAKGQA